MMSAKAEDRDVLAAEYVLGTLDGDERVQVQTLMILDPDFAATIQAWERRLGKLHVMLAPAAPPGDTWERITGELASTERIDDIRLPEVEWPLPPEAPVRETGLPHAAADVDALLRRLRIWRALALLLMLIGLAAAALVGLRSYRADLLPAELRPIEATPPGFARPSARERGNAGVMDPALASLGQGDAEFRFLTQWDYCRPV